jgi:hypothetical protein
MGAPSPCDECTVSPEDAGYLYVGDIFGSVAGPGIFDDYFAASSACQYERGCLTIPVEDHLWIMWVIGFSLLLSISYFKKLYLHKKNLKTSV